ncbi:MAG: hypothetical protein OEX18_03400 [Candidatus Krumholzibacteria bacterium]|nr:hypothetical protein [Candidatus Krumholzibacteria bacterium]MDH4336305.1 hypothetical protein [Candidatus Krumholzibacteria bacterium]MDH5269656.1 hypothetical protein [Candidatus Krumholzibacteria bacterium]MDH5626691.1 hypothetical protein [Candidatus Krumholzibacteria bacterium]
MKQLVVLCMLLSVVAIAACSESGGGEAYENQPPQVWLSAAPPEGSVSKYTVKLYWGGWDPDGEIRYYQYLVTDNKTGVFDPMDLENGEWLTVVANDSTFTFTADSLVNPNTTKLSAEFVRSHTFFIRAVDERGLKSEYAYRSFTSRTLSPEVIIDVPKASGGSAADVPPIATFRWRATDYVDDLNSKQDPESVQYVLKSTAPFGGNFIATLDYLRSPASRVDWSDWIYYKLPGDSGKSWTTSPQDFGTYMLAVRAKDEAGAITPVLDERYNARRVRVSTRTTGPLFYCSNIYMGSVSTTVCNTPATILDIPAGVGLDFRLTATADSYGGLVSGYRYGWDITDLDDPEQWEVDFTPFVITDDLGRVTAKTPARSFFFGTHVFTAEVIDNSGYCSRVEVKVNIVQFSLERNVLVVDDFSADNEVLQAGWTNPLGRGILPSDAEHDAFWLSMMDNVLGFDPTLDMVATQLGSNIPLTKLANYKSIIWSVYGDVATREATKLPELYRYILHRSSSGASTASGKVTPNLIALTMAAGGHILIAGQQPVQNVIPRSQNTPRFPFIFLYELEDPQTGTPDIDDPSGSTDFSYRELCLETLDLAYMTNQRLRNKADNYCRVVSTIRSQFGSLRDDTMREARPIDPNFPLLQLRPETAAPGKWHDPAVRGLDVEVYNPQYFATFCRYVPTSPRSCFQPIYGLGCNDVNEPTYNQPVAFFTSTYANKVADVPGAIGARSAVFGFSPVMFNPDQVRPAIEYILFNEWKLPRKATTASN